MKVAGTSPQLLQFLRGGKLGRSVAWQSSLKGGDLPTAQTKLRATVEMGDVTSRGAARSLSLLLRVSVCVIARQTCKQKSPFPLSIPASSYEKERKVDAGGAIL